MRTLRLNRCAKPRRSPPSQYRPWPGVAQLAISSAVTFAVAVSFGCGETDGVPIERIDFSVSDSELTVVATVNGEPVYSECVKNQMRATGVDRDIGLRQCIDFELLAQSANERGFGTHPDVSYEARRAAVRSLVEHEFLAKLASPETLPPGLLEEAFARSKKRYYRPEYRNTVYFRAPAKDIPAGSKADIEALRLASEVHEALKHRTDIDVDELKRVSHLTAKGREFEVGKPFNFPVRGRAVPEFADATFAIPRVGMVSPPTRTKWGWDVILLLEIMPEINTPFDEAKHELFAELREVSFARWLSAYEKRATVEIHRSALAETGFESAPSAESVAPAVNPAESVAPAVNPAESVAPAVNPAEPVAPAVNPAESPTTP